MEPIPPPPVVPTFPPPPPAVGGAFAPLPVWNLRLRSLVGSMREVQSEEVGGVSIQSSRWGLRVSVGEVEVADGFWLS